MIRLAAILIDDDPLVAMTWRNVAKSKNLQIAVFNHAESFRAAARSLDPATPVYVDSNLGNGMKGEDLSREIQRDCGFSHVFLATGYEPDRFAPMPWLSGIVGKEPPF